jgi:transposase
LAAAPRKLDQQIEQLELQLEDLEAEEAVAEAQAPVDMTPRKKAERKPLPPHLPREERVQRPAGDACRDCGGNLKYLGEDVSEQLEYVPASFRVIRHVHPKLTCACCDTIVQAPAASRPFERGIAGPGMLAHVLVAKFADHLPLYRQSVIYARKGVELERSLLASWVGAAGKLLRPLVDVLRRHVFAGTRLHADDTPLPVLSPGNGKTRTVRLWTYVRDDRASGDATPPAVWFAYSPDRKGEHPQAHLANFNSVLQADAYAGFNAVYDSGRASSKRPAGHTHGANFMTCMWPVRHRSRPRRCAGSVSCMASKNPSAESRSINVGQFGSYRRNRCSMTSNARCTPPWPRCRVNPIRQRRSCTPSSCGRR